MGYWFHEELEKLGEDVPGYCFRGIAPCSKCDDRDMPWDCDVCYGQGWTVRWIPLGEIAAALKGGING